MVISKRTGMIDIFPHVMILTKEILQKCLPSAKPTNIDLYLNPLNATLEKFEINNPKRVAAFLAQLAHESGSFKYVEELATGTAYEGRKDLGNTEPGDGVRFKGRGLIQITGRANYKAVGEALDYDFIENPEHLERPGAACMSAGWFWKTRGLNELADGDWFEKITRKINGGTNGLLDRLQHWERIKKVIK
jgi:putative chitinase